MCSKYRIAWDQHEAALGEDLLAWLREHPEAELSGGDIVPSLAAPVRTAEGWRAMRFGWRMPGMKRLLINARSETAAQRRMFAPRLKEGRCLVPALFFYEWSPDKEPYSFALPGRRMMYMAGLFLNEGTAPGFVILTRQAQGRPADIHPRMPVILESAELQDAWLHQDSLAEAILGLPPEALHRPLTEIIPEDVQNPNH